MFRKPLVTILADFEALHQRTLEETQKIVSELSLNLKGGKPDEATLNEFWLKPENIETYKKCSENPLEPEVAMKQYCPSENEFPHTHCGVDAKEQRNALFQFEKY
jgi:hypothetical protein